LIALSRSNLLALVTATLVGCSTLLDFPERRADPAAGVGGTAGQAGIGGQPSGAGGSAPDAGSDGSPDDADASVPPVDAPGDGASPGVIACGTEYCPTGGDYVCCGHPILGTKICAAFDQCPSPNLIASCDDTADCPPGGVCCADLLDGTGLTFTTRCRNNCAGPDNPVQVCKTAEECPSGQCGPHTCSSGAVIQACISTVQCQ
jgi:hypothetical protein